MLNQPTCLPADLPTCLPADLSTRLPASFLILYIIYIYILYIYILTELLSCISGRGILQFSPYGIIPCKFLCTVFSCYFIEAAYNNLESTQVFAIIRTHVCGSRHPTADLRQRIFPSFSFMFGCLHVSDSDLRHPTSDVRQRFFRSGTEKNRMASDFR